MRNIVLHGECPAKPVKLFMSAHSQDSAPRDEACCCSSSWSWGAVHHQVNSQQAARRGMCPVPRSSSYKVSAVWSELMQTRDCILRTLLQEESQSGL